MHWKNDKINNETKKLIEKLRILLTKGDNRIIKIYRPITLFSHLYNYQTHEQSEFKKMMKEENKEVGIIFLS